jgi:predicted Zn-dependent protease
MLFLLLWLAAGRAYAQHPDEHAEALTRASCKAGEQSEAVKAASAALERDPEQLGPPQRRADILVDQGCYQEAVGVLEAAQQDHSRSNELSAKLRAVRSLVTEQTYIEGLTQAAEGAKLQRNQLRCTRLADITACEDALKSKPDELPLLIGKGDALLQAARPAEAVAAYQRAAQLKPADEAIKTKLASAEALQASAVALASTTASASAAAGHVATLGADPSSSTPSGTAPGIGTSAADVGRSATDAGVARKRGSASSATHAGTPVESALASTAIEPTPSRTYSNEAPPGQSN